MRGKPDGRRTRSKPALLTHLGHSQLKFSLLHQHDFAPIDVVVCIARQGTDP
jgi:hypothetical protein